MRPRDRLLFNNVICKEYISLVVDEGSMDTDRRIDGADRGKQIYSEKKPVPVLPCPTHTPYDWPGI